MENIIEIIEEGTDWLAVGKPAGLSVHNIEDGTNLLWILEAELDCRLHAGHRLDQGTSGIMLLGKTARAITMIQKALKTATKEYTAILRGALPTQSGSWTYPITNSGAGYLNPQGAKKDRIPATTHFQVIKSNPYFSMVHLQLETGRHHQIRKHASLTKHAVIGDKRYGDKRYNKMIAKRYDWDQLCLCASKLEITLDGVDYCFEMPIPQNWDRLI